MAPSDVPRDAPRAAPGSGTPAASARGTGRRAAPSRRSGHASTRFSVSATGTAGIAPAAVSSAASRAGMVPGGISGRAASCTSTTSGARRSSASSPARTLSWRVAPPATGGRCGSPASAAAIAVASPTGCSRSASPASASAAWRITGLPASEQKLLRRLGAEPAAGAGGHQDRCMPAWRHRRRSPASDVKPDARPIPQL